MRTLPNAISLARALAVVPVVALLGRPDGAPAALVLFSVAALSDAVDGPLARRLGATSRLGAFLDPLADKILILGTLLGLLSQGAVEAWIVLVILGREVAVTALRGAAASRGAVIGASTYGKAKTVVQGVAVAGLLLAHALPEPPIPAAASVALAAALTLTLVSGIHVLLSAPRHLVPVPSRKRLADAR